MDSVGNWNKSNDEMDRLKKLLEENQFKDNFNALDTARQYEGLNNRLGEGFMSHLGDQFTGRMINKTGLDRFGVGADNPYMQSQQFEGQSMNAVPDGMQAGILDAIRGNQGAVSGGLLDFINRPQDSSGAINVAPKSGGSDNMEKIQMLMKLFGAGA